MNDFAYGALIGTTSVLVAMFWLSRIDRSLREASTLSEGRLAVAPAYKRFVIAFVTLASISVIAIIERTSTNTTENIIFYAFAVAAVFLVCRMVVDAFFLEARINSTGISGISRFGREHKILWSDVTSVKLDSTFNVFVIKSDKHKVRLSKYCIGIYPLLNELKNKAPSSSTLIVSNYLDHHSQ